MAMPDNLIISLDIGSATITAALCQIKTTIDCLGIEHGISSGLSKKGSKTLMN